MYLELEPVVSTIEVPKSSGIDGFIKLIRSILKLGRVQYINISANGTVEYKYLRHPENREGGINPEQFFEDVAPSHLIRSASILREVMFADDAHALEVLFRMLRSAYIDGVHPVAWASGAATILPKWLVNRSYLSEEQVTPCDTLLGFPVYKDRKLPDEALVLCATPERSAELAGMTHAYKIAMVLP